VAFGEALVDVGHAVVAAHGRHFVRALRALVAENRVTRRVCEKVAQFLAQPVFLSQLIQKSFTLETKRPKILDTS
jgi:hypothetical protein